MLYCVSYNCLLHPRGGITRPDGSTVTRASVWIEQEIAIATYIQQIEKRRLPIIAFKHRSVSLEGIRSLLHLNPIEFTNKDDILIALAERLNEWKSLTPSGIQLQMSSQRLSPQEGHLIRELQVTLVNDTPKVIAAYSLKVDIPKVLLKHWSVSFGGAEVTPPDPNTVSLRYNQVSYGQIEPRSTKPLFRTQYCIHCGGTDVVSATITSEQQITATIWVEGNEYLVRKTVRELAT